MRLLLTGAAGFVGGAILRRLVAEGHEVVALSSSGAGEDGPSVTWRRLDLLRATQDDLAELVRQERVSVCIHAAWYMNHADYLLSAANRDWTEATLRLEAGFRSGGGGRFVGLGTCIEYELNAHGGRLSEERTPLRPDTVYGAAKVQTFEQLSARAEAAGADFAWARLFFIYGPGDRTGRLVPYILASLSEGKPIAPRYGGLRRDYIHVDDLAGQLVRIAASRVQGAINTGTGKAEMIGDIFREAADLAGRHDLVEANDAVDPAQAALLEADLDRFTSLVGDPRTRPLRQGLAGLLKDEPNSADP